MYQIVPDGLVANWDASNWNGGTEWVDLVNNKIITFSSTPNSKSDDGVELTSAITYKSESLSSLNLSYPCTFEWLGRIDGSFSNTSPGHVFGLSTSLGQWSGICCYSKASSNGVQLDIGSSGTIASKIYTQGIEYHILITVDSNRTTTLYINDTVAKGNTTRSDGYGNKYYLYNNEGSGRFYGAIRRMCLWNKCLSSDEIKTLFTSIADGTGVFVKKSATWVEAQALYKKRNGVWVEIEAATLESEIENAGNISFTEI